MAKNSSDPQVAAKATQILQQFHQLAQQGANLGNGGLTNVLATGTGNTSASAAAPSHVSHGENPHVGAHPAGHR